MNWKQALSALKAGHRVRRPDWITALVIRNGAVEWDISVTLAKACSSHGSANRAYREWQPDVAASDWVLA